MSLNRSNHRIGQFDQYGKLIHLKEKYVVKQRQDLLALLPFNRTYKSIIEFGCADGTNLNYFAEKLNIPQTRFLA